MNRAEPSCHCILCVSYLDVDHGSPVESATMRHVRLHGWSVLMIPDDHRGPGWAYTVGLWHTHRMPELAMFGLRSEMSHTCLNDLGNKVGRGVPVAADQVRYDVIERFPVHLKLIDHRWYEAFFDRALAFYRRPVPFLQVVWPDPQGRFHWDRDSDERIHLAQPQLWKRPQDHPVGVWTQDL